MMKKGPKSPLIYCYYCGCMVRELHDDFTCGCSITIGRIYQARYNGTIFRTTHNGKKGMHELSLTYEAAK